MNLVTHIVSARGTVEFSVAAESSRKRIKNIEAGAMSSVTLSVGQVPSRSRVALSNLLLRIFSIRDTRRKLQ